MIRKDTKTLSLTLARTHDDLDSMRKSLVLFLEKHNVPEDAVTHMELCVYELLINIVEHSPPEYRASEMKFDCSVDGSKSVCRITSRGDEFDITKAKLPDMKEHYLSGENHGLGIYIIKTLMDDVEYSHNEGENTVLLVKKY